jgi:predicted glycosyltransferase
MDTPQRRVASSGLAQVSNPEPGTRLPSPLAHTAPRFLLYSHDTCGLGNIRRTLLLSQTLVAEYPCATVLIVTGSPVIHEFRIPERSDYIKLPCLDRTSADCYTPSFLDGCGAEVEAMRRGVLQKAVLGFAPDLMIVDKRPAGVGGELLDTIRALRARPDPPRLVVGIRDILDAPGPTRASLKRTRDLTTIARYYDEVWIYGERSIFDPTSEYDFPPEVTARTRFCGYLKRPTVTRSQRIGAARVLVTTGGGSDGLVVIETYLEALQTVPRDVPLRTTVVLGPQMPAADRAVLFGRYAALPGVQFVDFEPDLAGRYADADVVVSMAGYNTVCELLSFDLRAVLVPRAYPVGEQLLRARLFAARGLFDYVEPQDLNPAILMGRVLAALSRPSPSASMVDLDGLSRVRARVDALLRSETK